MLILLFLIVEIICLINFLYLLKDIKGTIRRWKRDHFSYREGLIQECEQALKNLLTRLVSCGLGEEEALLQDNKKDLIIELN